MLFEDHIRAGYPLLWIRTSEPERAQADLSARAANHPKLRYRSFAWDCDLGIREIAQSMPAAIKATDPIAAIKHSIELPTESVIFFHHFHKFLTSISVVQALSNAVPLLKQNSKTIVILSPLGGESVPVEISKLVTVMDFPLPTKEELLEKVRVVCEGAEISLPSEEETEAILGAATGLTALEAENAFALTVVRSAKFDHFVITEQKAQMIKKNGCLQYEKYAESFETLAGLENVKEFALKTASDPRSRGILLLGVPGTGKSHLAKALGKELKRVVLSLNFGSLFGSKVGQSEHTTIDTLKTVDAMAPCILFIDEIEKGISGINSSDRTDGGVGARVFGTFLGWIQDHESSVYTVATSNDVTKIPAEFLRSGRWDALFFVDLPNELERKQIYNIYRQAYSIDPCEETPDSTGWTGAEIKSVCRIAAMMNVPLKEATKYVVPISQFSAEKIEELRTWAGKRCVPASRQISSVKMNRQIRA